MIACFLSNISAKYYKNPSMLSRVIAKNVGDVFLRHSVFAVVNTVGNNVISKLSHFNKSFLFDRMQSDLDIRPISSFFRKTR